MSGARGDGGSMGFEAGAESGALVGSDSGQSAELLAWSEPPAALEGPPVLEADQSTIEAADWSGQEAQADAAQEATDHRTEGEPTEWRTEAEAQLAAERVKEVDAYEKGRAWREFDQYTSDPEKQAFMAYRLEDDEIAMRQFIGKKKK